MQTTKPVQPDTVVCAPSNTQTQENRASSIMQNERYWEDLRQMVLNSLSVALWDYELAV